MALSGKLPSMRAIYRARHEYLLRDGRKSKGVLTHADVGQGELRTMYAITGDEVLGDALRKGDVYTEDAKAIFDLPESITKCSCKEKTCQAPAQHLAPSARKASKEAHLAWQYAASLPTGMTSIWKRDYTIPAEVIIKAWQALPRRYWRTVHWWKEEEARVLKAGYSESRILFRRQVYPARPELSMVVNYPNQATLADHVNLWMLELDAELEKLFGKWVVAYPSRRQDAGSWVASVIPSVSQLYGGSFEDYLVNLSKLEGNPAGLVGMQHDAVDVDHPEELTDEVVKVLKRTGEVPRMIEGKEHVFPLEIKTAENWAEV